MQAYLQYKILQGLGVAQAAVTELWPWEEEKRPKVSFLFVKKNESYNISSREFPQSGQKQDGEKRKKEEKKWLIDGNNNGQQCIALQTPPQVAHAKPTGPIYKTKWICYFII